MNFVLQSKFFIHIWLNLLGYLLLYSRAKTVKEDFDRRFSLNYLGADTPVAKAMNYLEKGRLIGDMNHLKAAEFLLHQVKAQAVKNLTFVNILMDAAVFEMLNLSINGELWHVRPFIYYVCEKDALRLEVNAGAKKQLTSLKEHLLRWQKRSIELYETFMSANEAEELVKTKAAGLLAIVDAVMDKL